MTAATPKPPARDWATISAIGGIGLIGMVGWVQSYVSLRTLAMHGHEPEWEADIWPLVVDVFALIMGMVAVRGRRTGRHDTYAEILAATYSAGAIGCNVWLSWGDWVGVLVHGLPILTLVTGWHWILHRSQALVVPPPATAQPDATPPARREPRPGVVQAQPRRNPSATRGASPSTGVALGVAPAMERLQQAVATLTEQGVAVTPTAIAEHMRVSPSRVRALRAQQARTLPALQPVAAATNGNHHPEENS